MSEAAEQKFPFCLKPVLVGGKRKGITYKFSMMGEADLERALKRIKSLKEVGQEPIISELSDLAIMELVRKVVTHNFLVR